MSVYYGLSYSIKHFNCIKCVLKRVFANNGSTYCRTWDYKRSQTCLETIEHHTEFVYGLDFNLHVPGQVRHLAYLKYLCLALVYLIIINLMSTVCITDC